MSHSLFSRVQKIVAATVETAVDSAERASSLSLMRKAIRDVEATIEAHERTIADAQRTRDLATVAERTARAEIRKLEDAARYALDKGRDDLARAAVAQQMQLERQLAEHARTRVAAEQAGRAAADAIGDATTRVEQMRAELAALEKARARADADSVAPDAANAPDSRLRAAEAAFARAAKAAGAQPLAVTPESDVAEIAALRDADEIAARLTALKVKTPAQPRGTKRKAAPKRSPEKA